jgi:lysophospholipase L1-like esterase
VRGVAAVVGEIRRRAPEATVIVTGITPRADNRDVNPIIDEANRGIAQLADGKAIRYINFNDELTDAHGNLKPGMANDGLHLTPQAYQVWADHLKPIFTELLGPPGNTDQAPPPTGDPGAHH